jgi:hypothetical protein
MGSCELRRLISQTTRNEAFVKNKAELAERIQAASPVSCSRSPPMSWPLPLGACGSAKARSFRGRVTVLAIPVMYLLAKRKLAVAGRIGSRALRADAVESITCGWLAFVVVVGLLVQLALGAWWVDSVTSLAILWFFIKEAREAWAGEACCDDD